jgi:hypothetical protein
LNCISPYTITKTVSASGITTKPGCTLRTANWWSGVSLCGTSLGILCDGGYEGNNVSIHLSTSSVYFNGSVVTTCNDIIIYHGVPVNYEIYYKVYFSQLLKSFYFRKWKHIYGNLKGIRGRERRAA